MPKRFIKIGEKYEKNGEEKIAFKTLGEIFTGKNGKDYVKWYTLPGQLLHVMEDKPRDQAPAAEGEPVEPEQF